MVGPVDAILAGISSEAAQLIDSEYQVSPLANYYFMVVSTFVISVVATLVTHKWVEPALAKMPLSYLKQKDEPSLLLTPRENKALKLSVSVLLFVMLPGGDECSPPFTLLCIWWCE